MQGWRLLLALLALSGAARADRASEAALVHYDKAQAHYAVGEFTEAADEYLLAYKIKQDAALLFNAAQSLRLAGNHEKALVLYKNYLLFYPGERNIPAVREQVVRLRDTLAAAEKARSTPPEVTVEPAEASRTTEPTERQKTTETERQKTTEPTEVPKALAEPAPTPAPLPEVHPTASAPEPTRAATPSTTARHRTPLYRRWWLWTIVGVAVAGGVVTAAVLATRPSRSWTNGPDFGPGLEGLAVRW